MRSTFRGPTLGYALLGVLWLAIGLPGRAQAQQADCLIRFLGKSLASDSVRQGLQELGIVYRPEVAMHELIALPREGVLLKTQHGILQRITLFNDSIPYNGTTYRRFRGAVPLGLTFSDSLGFEENLLFRQEGVDYGQTDEGINYGSILTISNGLSYNLVQGYLPADQYYFYKRTYPSVRLHRTLFYRYELVRKPRGPYLNLPLICGNSQGGAFSTGVLATRKDSSYYIDLSVGYRALANSGAVRRALNDGLSFSLSVMFPISARLSPPLLHVIGIEGASHSYRDSTSTFRLANDASPNHNMFGLHYGLAYMPWVKRPGFVPMAQIVGGGQIDYSPSMQYDATTQAVKSSSSTFFYQLSGGAGYQFKSGIIVQVMAHYRATRYVQFLKYNWAAPDVFSLDATRLRTFAIEATVRINLTNY